jgi:hypothetical protein
VKAEQWWRWALAWSTVEHGLHKDGEVQAAVAAESPAAAMAPAFAHEASSNN